MIRYVATFQPQAWIRDYAVDVDIESGDAYRWDATAYLTDPANERFVGDLRRDADEIELGDVGGVIDVNDVLARDPAAPPLVRRHVGPFTITVFRTGSDPSALRGFHAAADGDAEAGGYDPSDPWSEHPDWTVADWKHEVASDATRRSYHDWVAANIEAGS